jgi:ABC-type uncharacterized transport system substrate-binding protein
MAATAQADCTKCCARRSHLNPETAPFTPLFTQAIEVAAPSFGIAVQIAPVHDAAIEKAIAAEAREPGSGLVVLPDSFSITHRDVIIAAAAHSKLPLVGGTDVVPRAGALLSYWENSVDVHSQAASYIDRILRGANPADVPVQQPTKFSLIINLKTARALNVGLKGCQAQVTGADDIVHHPSVAQSNRQALADDRIVMASSVADQGDSRRNRPRDPVIVV